jgi:excisionase family DNA binding protein
MGSGLGAFLFCALKGKKGMSTTELRAAAERGINRLMTVEELADQWGESRWQIYDLCRRGLIPHIRLGKAIRFDPVVIAEFVRQGGTAA